MPFALDNDPSPSELSGAVNYLLANFVASTAVNSVTGEITSGGTIVGYLYKYIGVKYANSFDGKSGFSDTPTNKQYYGVRNSDSSAESSNPTDYYWRKATGGFGITKFLWYQTTGGRQINFAVATAAPDVGWLQDPLASIDLDEITSGTVPPISEAFFSYFSPSVLLVPRSGNPLAPVFTNIVPAVFAIDKGVIVPFVDAQADADASFVNNTWRIGNSSTTGNADISYNNITVGNPTDAGDFAEWPNPTAMPDSPAYIQVPIRYKNSLGAVNQASVATLQLLYSDPGETGETGPSIDISGFTSFVQNAGGAFTPTLATLSAVVNNVVSPTYSWTISGGTPTTSTASSVAITPNSSTTGVTVTLEVNGASLLSPISKTIILPVVYDGAPGQAGANGVMSAFPSIYIWTGASVPPTRPTTTSTYTWSTGAYTAPTGWSTSPPSNTVAGNYLWQITIPLNVSATTTTSSLDWTNTTYTIRAIAYNGANGSNGTNGTNGSNGSNGAATFVITRTANDSSAPTNAEVTAILGRNPVAGDICTVNYNAGNNSVVYRYVTTWTLFQTYITGSLIVQNTITADKLSVSTLSAISADLGTVTAGNLSIGNVVRTGSVITSGSGAKIEADGKFALGNSTGSLVFDGTATAINGALVGTLNILNNAVTNLQSYFSTANVSLTSGVNQTLITLPITAQGKPITINVQVNVDRNNSASSVFVIELLKDTNGIFSYSLVLPANNASSLTFPLVYVDTPSAGNYNYIVKMQHTGSGAATVTARSMFINEIKR